MINKTIALLNCCPMLAEVPLPADEYNIKHIRWLERFPYDKHSNTHHPQSVALKVNPRVSCSFNYLTLLYPTVWYCVRAKAWDMRPHNM